MKELTAENKMMIDEIVKLRKSGKDKKMIASVRSDSKKHQKSQQKFLDDQDEVQSYEKLFSEDEGPVALY